MTNNTFFTSDNHFYHANIIKYCDRPWNSGVNENNETIVTNDDVERMNEAMIANWNSVVGKNDIVWNLGDFCFGDKENVKKTLARLNGKVNLVLGNHDQRPISFYYDAGFNKVYDHPIILNDFFILSHEPMPWVKNPFFSIFGHVHDNSIYNTWNKNGCCVCVERHNYTPVSWKTIAEQISKFKEIEQVVQYI